MKKKRSEDTVENLFTQELDSDYWKFQVWTVLENSKFGSSFPATLKIFHNKRKGSEKDGSVLDQYFTVC